MAYAFGHQDKVFTPDGTLDIKPADVAEYNRKAEAAELRWLETGPDRVFLYVEGVSARSLAFGSVWTGHGSITTFLGTVLDDAAQFGPVRKFPCFGPFPSKRRAVRCRIFGRRYHGWYYESSGDYCRLTRTKDRKTRAGRSTSL